jgi:hypothetical protein
MNKYICLLSVIRKNLYSRFTNKVNLLPYIYMTAYQTYIIWCHRFHRRWPNLITFSCSFQWSLWNMLLWHFKHSQPSHSDKLVYFDWKTVIYIYVCGKCHTQFMLSMEKSVTFTGACANEIIPSINRSFVYKAKNSRHILASMIYFLNLPDN